MAVAALAARAEGWAAGLQLAALALRGQPDAEGFVSAFTGSHRFILDFLAEEVLEQQSEQVRTFLLETSVLERLRAGDLCNAVTGRTGSQSLLEQVERAGLFLVPLDEVRGWWRYHHLFADLLRARLQQEQADRVVCLHRNAATWCQEHGLPDDAVRHAVAAGETTWAARLIERYFDERYYLSGEGTTLQRWLSALPDDVARSRPRLLLAPAQLAIASGRVEEMEPLLDAAERAAPGAAGEPFEPTVGRAGSMLVNVPALIAIRRAFLAQLRGDAEAGRRSPRGPWPSAARASGCSALPPWGSWRWPKSSWPWRKPSAPSRPAPPGGRRSCSARFDRVASCSARPGPAGPGPPDAAVQTGDLAGAGSHRGARPGASADRLPVYSWAWPRWPTSRTNSTAPSGTSPRASR